MSLIVPENRRKPGSKITDTEILRTGDELRLLGVGFVAIIGLLDSHDPSAAAKDEEVPTIAQQLGWQRPALANHHHVLLKMEDSDEVFSTGMYVGTGEPEDLLFHHRRLLIDDEDYTEKLRRIIRIVQGDNHGLYYMSDQEGLSSTPEGQVFLSGKGKLLISPREARD